MKSILRRCIGYSVLCVVGILVTSLFIAIQFKEAAIACGVASAVALILLQRQRRQLYVAKLICDNRILTVPGTRATTENSASMVMEETVVSTFGLLLGNKLYKWGCNGMHGVRLQELRIFREHIWLTFGSNDDKISFELLHGMTNKQKVLTMAKKLLHETGVVAKVCDW